MSTEIDPARIYRAREGFHCGTHGTIHAGATSRGDASVVVDHPTFWEEDPAAALAADLLTALRGGAPANSSTPTAPAGPERVPEIAPRRGRAGRPSWTDEAFLERWQEAVATTPAPRTFATIAPNMRHLGQRRGEQPHGFADPDHLSDLWHEHGEPSFE